MVHPYKPSGTAGDFVARAARIAADVASPHADEVDTQPRFPAESMKALAEQGFYGLCLPQESGVSRVVVFLVTKRRSGLLGWALSKALLGVSALLLRALKDDDRKGFANMRYSLGRLRYRGANWWGRSPHSA